MKQEICDAAVAKLPDRSIQNEVVEIHQRGKDEEAAGEIEVEDVAGDPGAGNEECNAAGDEHSEISERTPILPAFGAGFPAGVVAGDPEILSGVHHRQHARAVAALRHAKTLPK